ncbi:DNA adenine methylase [Chloroflexia bacterium SDU3-3]|nr:DNA adenine methylase [Chloroflexia bacterium SDU3-3]
MPQPQHDSARPFIKWVGGKGQLLPELVRRLPRAFRRYHEPFLGGAALFFFLHRAGRLREGAVLSDYNRELIDCYQVVRDDLPALLDRLREHERHALDRDYFLDVRAWDRRPGFAQLGKVELAARTLFLNRTCYNGLYRLNRRHQFNAPFGHYKKPRVYDAENLTAASAALRTVELRQADFADVLHTAQEGDLVYFDPPYIPLSITSAFTHYTGHTFGAAEQRRLAHVTRQLAERGVAVMLSNSDTAQTRQIYLAEGFSCAAVSASRKINCDGRKRGAVQELIVCSYGWDA